MNKYESLSAKLRRKILEQIDLKRLRSTKSETAQEEVLALIRGSINSEAIPLSFARARAAGGRSPRRSLWIGTRKCPSSLQVDTYPKCPLREHGSHLSRCRDGRNRTLTMVRTKAVLHYFCAASLLCTDPAGIHPGVSKVKLAKSRCCEKAAEELSLVIKKYLPASSGRTCDTRGAVVRVCRFDQKAELVKP